MFPCHLVNYLPLFVVLHLSLTSIVPLDKGSIGLGIFGLHNSPLVRHERPPQTTFLCRGRLSDVDIPRP